MILTQRAFILCSRNVQTETEHLDLAASQRCHQWNRFKFLAVPRAIANVLLVKSEHALAVMIQSQGLGIYHF